MRSCRVRLVPCVLLVVVIAAPASQAQTNSSSSSSAKHAKKTGTTADSRLNAGTLRDGIYRNTDLGFSCKLPAGWVLRTEEMNVQDEHDPGVGGQPDPQTNQPSLAKADVKSPPKTDSRVLLAAFSRPPQAVGEDVNSSILIAAESASAYPGLKEAVQYFEPLAEVAKEQGFSSVNEPYEFPIGAKLVVREDFQKSVGSRVMRQSTLVVLAHGYAVSFTFIAGTEQDAEELIDGLSFAATRSATK